MKRVLNDSHRAFALPGARSNYGPDKRVRVEHIDLHLRPFLAERRLEGVCTTTIRALDEPVERVELDAVDLRIAQVEAPGYGCTFEHRDDRLHVHFSPAIPAGAQGNVAITYSVSNPRAGLFFILPDDDHPQRPAHAWTQSQDENARYWLPCFDYPHEKQTTSATIIVPKGLYALSNGALMEKRDEGDTTTYRYEQNVPHSTYLLTLVVGPFAEIEQGTAGKNAVPVSFSVLPGRQEDGKRSFGATPAMIECFEKKTAMPYPYARYTQIAVAEFIFGGMENTSATTQTDRTLHDARAHLDFSSDPLVSHELAHQWFGDLLTCRDWSHAWLNEGFATYFECVWREADLGWDEYLYDVFGCVARYVDEDSDRYRRPIVCNRFRDPIELFDRHLYEKGGAVLHMLRGELGEARFWRAIQTYVASNATKNVETIDLIRAIETSTGRNMRGFFDRWVFDAGHPQLDIDLRWDEERRVLIVTVDQKQTIDDTHPAFTFDLIVGSCQSLSDGGLSNVGPDAIGDERRVAMHIDGPHTTLAIHAPSRPKLVRLDPGAYVLSEMTFVFGADDLIAILAHDPDPIARIRAARALCKDGSAKARTALADALRNEPFWGVLDELCSALAKTRAPWAQELLMTALTHAHPKVRRAAAQGLGNFRDATAADALLPVAKGDASYFVQAAALTSLGKTRDERAFDVLQSFVSEHSWNGTIEAAALRGMAELADERVIDSAILCADPGRDEGLRRAVPGALARIGALIENQRSTVVQALDLLLDDAQFLVQLGAIAAAESLGDARLIPSLSRLSVSGFDGRVRRDAAEAILRIQEARSVPAQVEALRSDLDALRTENRKLAERIAALDPR